MAALGLGQFALLIALLNFGLQHIGAAQAALIFSLLPLLTMLLSAMLGRDNAGQKSHQPESKTVPPHGLRGTAEA